MLFVMELVLVTAACLLLSLYYVQMLQQQSYQVDGYIRWARRQKVDQLLGSALYIGVGAMVARLVLGFMLGLFLPGQWAPGMASFLTGGFMVVASFIVMHRQKGEHSKKPLHYTARVKRLLGVMAALHLLVGALLCWLGLTWFLAAAVPFMVPLAALAAQPMEGMINGRYFADAQRKIAGMPDLMRIGITGSYGKTSVKFILGTILSEKYRVLVPSASLNTPMGLTKLIREQLSPTHQVFIAEMGARHVGDIAELCRLVSPQYGLITSVGPQHLETFGTVDTVMNTKYELIEGLPGDGVAFFCADDGYVDKMYLRCGIEKQRVGIASGALNMWAEEITCGPEGSRFFLVTQDGKRAEIRTRLLGEHNIKNIVLCCAVARRLGMEIEEIARGVLRVEPVEHRLQLIRGGASGVTVIDDAFNSNPQGSKAAMDVLSAFPGRRFVVTPGMVELGEQEEALNREFGAYMAGRCDVAILVGEGRTRPIREGLLSAGFDPKNIHIAHSLAHSSQIFAGLAKPGDVVLYENDLPDSYAEQG